MTAFAKKGSEMNEIRLKIKLLVSFLQIFTSVAARLL
jgi:hypothetical protein